MIKLLWDYIKRFFNNETDFNSNGINDRKELINKLHLYLINQDKIKEEKIQKREDKKNNKLIKKLLK
jgi:hypothetical protein|tara:strand:- start:356 stop:556 length:201 start_codon:yes stop_codon:yes gene_type:complete